MLALTTARAPPWDWRRYKPAGAACNTIVRNGTNECPLLSTCDGFNPVCKGTQYCGG
jgi:hypothetical protein